MGQAWPCCCACPVPEEDFGEFNLKHGYGAWILSDITRSDIFKSESGKQVDEMHKATVSIIASFNSIYDTLQSMNCSCVQAGANHLICQEFMMENGQVGACAFALALELF